MKNAFNKEQTLLGLLLLSLFKKGGNENIKIFLKKFRSSVNLSENKKRFISFAFRK